MGALPVSICPSASGNATGLGPRCCYSGHEPHLRSRLRVVRAMVEHCDPRGDHEPLGETSLLSRYSHAPRHWRGSGRRQPAGQPTLRRRVPIAITPCNRGHLTRHALWEPLYKRGTPMHGSPLPEWAPLAADHARWTGLRAQLLGRCATARTGHPPCRWWSPAVVLVTIVLGRCANAADWPSRWDPPRPRRSAHAPCRIAPRWPGSGRPACWPAGSAPHWVGGWRC